jgi:glycogen debranching enzyme
MFTHLSTPKPFLSISIYVNEKANQELRWLSAMAIENRYNPFYFLSKCRNNLFPTGKRTRKRFARRDRTVKSDVNMDFPDKTSESRTCLLFEIN